MKLIDLLRFIYQNRFILYTLSGTQMDADTSEMVRSLTESGALAFGDFTLTSGRKSRYYVDIKRAITQPGFLRTVAKLMAPHARSADRIAGVELGAVPIAAAVSLANAPCLNRQVRRLRKRLTLGQGQMMLPGKP